MVKQPKKKIDAPVTVPENIPVPVIQQTRQTTTPDIVPPLPQNTTSTISTKVTRSKRVENIGTKLEQGVIIHDIKPMSPDVNNSRTFHFDPDVPHVIHDKNNRNRNYKETEFAPVSPGEENDSVLTHSGPTYKPTFLEAENPHTDYTGPKTIVELNLIFGNEIDSIVEQVLDNSELFDSVDVEFKTDSFMVVQGEDGFAPATDTTPTVLRTTKFKGISYLLHTMMREFKKTGHDTEKLMDILIDMLQHSMGVDDWLEQINLLWNEIKP